MNIPISSDFGMGQDPIANPHGCKARIGDFARGFRYGSRTPLLCLPPRRSTGKAFAHAEPLQDRLRDSLAAFSPRQAGEDSGPAERPLTDSLGVLKPTAEPGRARRTGPAPTRGLPCLARKLLAAPASPSARPNRARPPYRARGHGGVSRELLSIEGASEISAGFLPRPAELMDGGSRSAAGLLPCAEAFQSMP